MNSSSVQVPAQDATNKNASLSWRVFWNTVANYFGKLVTLGVGFLLTPFLVHSLGPSTYGLWVLVGSVVAYGALLDFGIAAAITKYVAEYRANYDTQQVHSLIATVTVMYLALGMLVIVIAVPIAIVFPVVFNVPPAQRNEATWLVILSSVAVGIAIPCTTTNAILRGLQRFDFINLLGVVGTLLSAASTVL